MYLEPDATGELPGAFGERSVTVNYQDRLIQEIAKRERDRLVQKSIYSLRRMKEGLQSGEDSGLRTLWNEICVQTQAEYSVFWEAYLDTMRQIVASLLEDVDATKRSALWLQTEPGIEWSINPEDQSAIGEMPISDFDIAEYVLDHILEKAENWTNKRVEKYLTTSCDYF